MTRDNSFQHGFRRAYERDRERQRGHHRPRRPVGRVIGGSLIVLWGLMLLLDNLGLGDVRPYVDRAWPAVLAIVGVTLLIHRGPHNRHAFWGTVWMFAGVCAYVAQQDWIHASFWALFWPMLIVLFGASFAFHAFRGACGRTDTQVNTSPGRSDRSL